MSHVYVLTCVSSKMHGNESSVFDLRSRCSEIAARRGYPRCDWFFWRVRTMSGNRRESATTSASAAAATPAALCCG